MRFSKLFGLLFCLFVLTIIMIPDFVFANPPAAWDTNYRTAAMTEGASDDYVIAWKGEHSNYCIGIVKHKSRALNDLGTAISEDWAIGYYATKKIGTVNNCTTLGNVAPQRPGILYLHGNFDTGSFMHSINHAKAVEVPGVLPFSFSISAPGQGPKCDNQQCEECATDQDCITYFGDPAGECRQDCCCFSCTTDA